MKPTIGKSRVVSDYVVKVGDKYAWRSGLKDKPFRFDRESDAKAEAAKYAGAEIIVRTYESMPVYF